MLRWLLGLPREGTPIGADGTPRPCIPRDGGRGVVACERCGMEIPSPIHDIACPERYRGGYFPYVKPLHVSGHR